MGGLCGKEQQVEVASSPLEMTEKGLAKVDAAGKSKSTENIEQQLQLSAIQSKLKFKILFLGSGESGKSTILKSMKNINKITLTEQEQAEIIKSLKRNALQCMKVAFLLFLFPVD
ncbi:hypothetical protein HK102_003584 [Quaeritorhiza haematococci]|nr:hypothetical protein HK102_003584 [Quaeritorhiza haematococci]